MQRNCSRYCHRCNKAHKACICEKITPIGNNIPLLILQHPSEVNQAKGTARILSLSLEHSQLIVGEEFDQNTEFLDQLDNSDINWHLLYPSDNAKTITSLSSDQNVHNLGLVLLDGTWKKAFKMYQLSQRLQMLPALVLPDDLTGNYRIRKTAKTGGLSTVEAGYHALSLLANDNNHYQPLIDCFDKMVAFHLSQLPPDVYERQFGPGKKTQ
ncbi:tRNA-uridine aminocarboxypropyltransferase [Veronia pacifica]|uniref:tRNA-uridine aminocarboxypropyltransferase n=1 Tax=Veronia pacifica TaxID=1080227 RepID=A0A1C3ERD5_9GAMM|nr:tRNA-uridine aminocarboxypropyltransferase [Veronia pacifica]ODA35790.1 DTW domain-containing protein [Veronia pacifica]